MRFLIALLLLPAVASQAIADGFASDPASLARGIVKPANQATLATDISAPVARIGFKQGEAFRKGDVLIEFDCRRHRAELASAEAQLKEMRVALESNAFLEKMRAVGKHETEISRARVEKAAADAEAMRVRLEQCTVVAPFNGRVSELGLYEHELPVPQKPFLTILEADKLEIELIVPSDWLVRLKPGSEFEFSIDETKSSYPARLTRLGAAVDPVSQTAKVMGEFVSVDAEVRPGMSGAAQFDKPQG